jgi:hypothetical protein
MRIGIDIDGVLGYVEGPGVVRPWRATRVFSALLESLQEMHQIFFVTACCGPDSDPEAFRPVREHHLRDLGLGHLSARLLLTRHNEKGAICREMGLDMLIDDSDDNLAQVRAASPRTICLKFIPPATMEAL